MTCGGYFYAEMLEASPSPPSTAFGWDYLNPFVGMKAMGINGGIFQSSEEEVTVVRGREGALELEEEVQKAKRVLAPAAAANVVVRENGWKAAKRTGIISLQLSVIG